jgi:hypothetical protein
MCGTAAFAIRNGPLTLVSTIVRQVSLSTSQNRAQTRSHPRTAVRSAAHRCRNQNNETQTREALAASATTLQEPGAEAGLDPAGYQLAQEPVQAVEESGAFVAAVSATFGQQAQNGALVSAVTGHKFSCRSAVTATANASAGSLLRPPPMEGTLTLMARVDGDRR